MSRVPGCGWMTVFRRFPNRYSRNSAKRSQNMRLHTCEPMPGFSCHFRLLQLAAAHLCVNVSLTVLSVKSSTLLLATPHLFSEVASPEARDVGRARLRPGLLGITCVPPRVVPSIRSP
ncbi:wd repeat protein, partial [Moniliophthora roreri]